MKQSIRNRLLGTTTGVLVIFLTLTGWVLDQSFQASIVTGAEEQLRLVIYSLMGGVEDEGGRLKVGEDLSEPRLSQPESGLYAQLSDDINGPIWTSPSAVTSDVSFIVPVAEPGAFTFAVVTSEVPRFALSYAVIWEGAEVERVTFSAITDQAPFSASISQFRRSLGLGFVLAMAVFVVAQVLALRWGLRPLRVMADEVEALESGQADRLQGGYPRELQGLANNLERFIDHEQRSRARYRHALEDLAHSLKTPLAVFRNALIDKQLNRPLLSEQLDRMESTVTHQLSKASARGPVVVGKAVDVARQVERLLRALETAYADKDVSVEMRGGEAVLVRGDESDFLELFGNLAENAFKYGVSKVRVGVQGVEQGARVTIEDDGPGIPASLRAEVLDRGKRLDELKPGQGIGLAVVAELVSLYSGTLEIAESELGGAFIGVNLPG